MAFTAEAVRAEMQAHVRTVADLAPDTSRKAGLSFAARALGLPVGRIKSLFYGEARRVDAHEADQIRAYVQAAEKLIQARKGYEAIRNEYLATAHPGLLHLAPRPLGRSEAADEAARVIAEHKGR